MLTVVLSSSINESWRAPLASARPACDRDVCQIESMLCADFLQEEIGNQLVEVVPTEMSIAIGGEDLEDAVFNFRIEISNVPPPRSYTAIVPCVFF